MIYEERLAQQEEVINKFFFAAKINQINLNFYQNFVNYFLNQQHFQKIFYVRLNQSNNRNMKWKSEIKAKNTEFSFWTCKQNMRRYIHNTKLFLVRLLHTNNS